MNAKKRTRQLKNPPPKSRSKIETVKEPETNPHKTRMVPSSREEETFGRHLLRNYWQLLSQAFT